MVQDMLVLKYGLELDELDFINKAKALVLQPSCRLRLYFRTFKRNYMWSRGRNRCSVQGPGDMFFSSHFDAFCKGGMVMIYVGL